MRSYIISPVPLLSLCVINMYEGQLQFMKVASCMGKEACIFNIGFRAELPFFFERKRNFLQAQCHVVTLL